MIDLETKIHDKFTLEFKVGFNTETAERKTKFRDYVMNTWIFVPNSLDINAAKYSKEDFYRDLPRLSRNKAITCSDATESTNCKSLLSALVKFRLVLV